MFRRKPPQLSILDELSQTYTDVTNTTFKNLHHEENNKFEDALKGWKSLHTSLLFKLELFDKSITKMSPEELQIFNELRAIRDQNVKHLVRVQLRMDELNRKKPVITTNKSNMTVPSLRQNGMRSMNNVGKKKMVKSLRPTAASTPNTKSQHQASMAANLSWQKPKVDDDLFDDFDQDYQVKPKEEPNLIDLDDYFQMSHSMENLSVDDSSVSSESPSNSLLSPPRDKRSTSTPDMSDKYVYNKPKPMNIGRLMKQSKPTKTVKLPAKSPAVKSPPVKSPVVKSPAVKPAVVKPPATKPLRPTTKAKPSQPKKSNITYNYVSKNGGPAGTTTTTTTTNANAATTTLREPDDSNLLNPKTQQKLIQLIRGIDELAAKQILNDIVVHGDQVYWDDIVGLDGAKNSLKEAVVYPFLRPDLFKGLREPTRGMLLFGPPGTGKTMLARAVATESKSTFFSITASSITSKYLGESEKLVRALFLLARKLSPLIVFIDEIDSLLGSRSEGELESIRRIKNEFLIQWSELSSSTTKENDDSDDKNLNHQVLILGATNMPWSIDEAARRRFVKRQYIPLPEQETRLNQIKRLLKYQKHTISDSDFDEIIKLTEQFSGSDITALCKDSAMGPLRSLGELLLQTPTEEIRPINISDFLSSLTFIKPSVLQESLKKYEEWAQKFGSLGV